MEIELIKTISHIILGTGAVITALVGLIKGVNAFIDYISEKKKLFADIKELFNDMTNIKLEQKMCYKGLMACLDGLEQLGCNHTVTATKKELEEWLNTQAHN